MLYLIGLGLDKKDISLKALEVVKKCSKIYLENYTAKLPYSVKELHGIIKKKLIPADRELVENKFQGLLDEAKKKNIALLIYGNPLSATTHFSLLMGAKKQKIKTGVIHAPSILTAISETGLHLYNFGKTASLPRWQEGYKPTSFFEVIKKNMSIKAHTLLLIDIGMNVQDALKQLSEVFGSAFQDNLLIICSQVGTLKQKIVKGKLKELVRKSAKLRIKEPFCFIIPAPLNFTEAEALKKF